MLCQQSDRLAVPGAALGFLAGQPAAGPAPRRIKGAVRCQGGFAYPVPKPVGGGTSLVGQYPERIASLAIVCLPAGFGAPQDQRERAAHIPGV